MEKLLDSFIEWLGERNSSSIYFTYVLFLILYNWRVLYILFFGNNDTYSSRLEDLDKLLQSVSINYFDYFSKIPFLSVDFISILSKIVINFLPFLVPVLLTIISVKYLPLVNNWAHSISTKAFFHRKFDWDQQKSDYIFKKEEELRSRSSAVSRIKEAEEKEQVLDNNLDNFFDTEYKEGISTDLPHVLYQLYVIYYEDGGSLSSYKNKRNNNQYDTATNDIRLNDKELSKILSYADVHRLIEINDNIISFTNKGRRFIENFIGEGRHLG